MMKKLIAILLAVFVLSTAALAVGHGRGGHGIWSCDGTGNFYADTNEDGLCDYYGTGTCGMGRAYVDADGDGVCDHYGTGRCGGAHCGWAAQ